MSLVVTVHLQSITLPLWGGLFSTSAYATHPSDLVAVLGAYQVVADARIVSVNVSRHLSFWPWDTTLDGGDGVVVLSNADGALNNLILADVGQISYWIREGDDQLPWAQHRLIAVGVSDKFVVNRRRATLTLGPALPRWVVPMTINNGSALGGSNYLQFGFGQVIYGLGIDWIGDRTYWGFSDFGGVTINAVYEDGISQAFTVAIKYAVTAALAGSVVADITIDNGTAPTDTLLGAFTHAHVWAGFSGGGNYYEPLDSAELTAISTLTGTLAWCSRGEQLTGQDVLRLFAASSGSAYYMARDGYGRYARMIDPAGATPDGTITASQMQGGIDISKDLAPNLTTKMECEISPGGVGSGSSGTAFTQQSTLVTAAVTTHPQYFNAGTRTAVKSALVLEADAQAELDRIFTIYATLRVKVELKYLDEWDSTLDISSIRRIVDLDLYAYGDKEVPPGKNMILTRWIYSAEMRQGKLERKLFFNFWG